MSVRAATTVGASVGGTAVTSDRGVMSVLALIVMSVRVATIARVGMIVGVIALVGTIVGVIARVGMTAPRTV
ncbi:MAG: hypothetical protein ACTHZW_09175, partial [Microbacteriaceae bacterium]